MKWVSVDNSLPEHGTPVLIITDYGKMDVCHLGYGSGKNLAWYNHMRSQHTNGGVTHWMPLPAPPKSGERTIPQHTQETPCQCVYPVRDGVPVDGAACLKCGKTAIE